MAATRAAPSARAQSDDVIVVHEPDGDVATSRNAAASQAKHDWLCFLDGDDELAFGFVGQIQNAEIPGDDVLYTPAVQYVIGGRRRRPPRIWPEVNLEFGNWLIIGTVIHRDLFWTVGGFRPFAHGLEDFALWGRCWRYGCQIVKVPKAVYVAHQNPRTSKHHQLRQNRGEYQRQYELARADILSQQPCP